MYITVNLNVFNTGKFATKSLSFMTILIFGENEGTQKQVMNSILKSVSLQNLNLNPPNQSHSLSKGIAPQ